MVQSVVPVLSRLMRPSSTDRGYDHRRAMLIFPMSCIAYLLDCWNFYTSPVRGAFFQVYVLPVTTDYHDCLLGE